MDIGSSSLAPDADTCVVERLHSELEQARVALEDMDARIAELSVSNGELQDRLRDEVRRREEMEREVQHLRETVVAAPSESPVELALREQLGTALEELHVMAEELALAQDAIRLADASR